MKLPEGFDLIIFDCDGVLVDSEVLSMRAHQGLFAELGATPSAELWGLCFGHKQAEIFAIMEKAVRRFAPPELRAQLWPRTKALFAAELKSDAWARGIPRSARRPSVRRLLLRPRAHPLQP